MAIFVYVATPGSRAAGIVMTFTFHAFNFGQKGIVLPLSNTAAGEVCVPEAEGCHLWSRVCVFELQRLPHVLHCSGKNHVFSFLGGVGGGGILFFLFDT